MELGIVKIELETVIPIVYIKIVCHHEMATDCL
jgi:hypothetical protein